MMKIISVIIRGGFRIRSSSVGHSIESSVLAFQKMGSINCKEYATENGGNRNDVMDGANCSGSYQSRSEMCDTYIDPVKVCHINDLADGEMRQFDFVNGVKVLVVKRNGQIFALGNKCTHYGAPLHTGVLGNGRVRCPWHGACFNVETGDIEDFPGLDSLPCYRVNIGTNGDVKIAAKRNALAQAKRLKDMVKRKLCNPSTFVVLGGGPAGGVCVETLRQEGYTGRIVLVAKEPYLPYDRVKVSKSADVEIGIMQYRPQEFYDSYDIETYLDVTADAVNGTDKTVTLSNGEQIKFDKLFVATGSTPIRPPSILNIDKAKNIFTVREYDDLLKIRKEINDTKHVICLGSSFISLEAAQMLVKRVASMTIISRSSYLLQSSFGVEIGKRIIQLFRENDVQLLMETNIKRIILNENGLMTHVEIHDDTQLPCDVLILGTGTQMNTKFLIDSGLKINTNGSIDTDEYLRSGNPDIYIGGDIANAPVLCNKQQRATIGHYQLAQYHGRMAAINMVASHQGQKLQPIAAVPFFFTMLFGKGLRYAGYGAYKDIIIDGSLDDMKFVAYFINGEEQRVIAVASCGRDPIVAQFAEYLSQGRTLYRKDLHETDMSNWTKAIKTT